MLQPVVAWEGVHHTINGERGKVTDGAPKPSRRPMLCSKGDGSQIPQTNHVMAENGWAKAAFSSEEIKPVGV